jgi:hypothetical protein
MLKKFLSRKLIATVVGGALTTFLLAKGISPDKVDMLVTLLLTYIGGQSVVDAVNAFKLPVPPSA